MKKVISLAGFSLVIATQILPVPVLAAEVMPEFNVNGLHSRSDAFETIPEMNHVAMNSKAFGKDVHPVDRACANKQIAEIKEFKKSLGGDKKGLDIDEVQINLVYGDKLKGHKLSEANYAQVRTEHRYQLPFTEVRFGKKRVLEIGIVMPEMPYGRHPSSCVIAGREALQKAIDEPGANISDGGLLVMSKGAVVDLGERSAQLHNLNAWLKCGIDLSAKQRLNRQQQSCLSEVDTVQPAAVSNIAGGKARKPASGGAATGSSSGSAGAKPLE